MSRHAVYRNHGEDLEIKEWMNGLLVKLAFLIKTAKQCGEDHNINVYSSKEPSEAIP